MIDRGSPEYGDVFEEQKPSAEDREARRRRWIELYREAMSKGMVKYAAEIYADFHSR